MTSREIIDIQLESFFGGKFPKKIQGLIDEELNQGRWADGYDVAVCQGVIDGEDARKLLEIILTQHPELRIDRDLLMQTVEDELPQSMGAPVSWIVDETGAFALSDSLRVARFEGAQIIWCSRRISFDGIEFDSLLNGKLCGRAWLASKSVTPDSAFTFAFDTGKLLDGQYVQF